MKNRKHAHMMPKWGIITYSCCVKDRHHILSCTEKVLEHDKVNGITFTLACGKISDVQNKNSFFLFFFFSFSLMYCIEHWPNSQWWWGCVLRIPDAVFGAACKPNHISRKSHNHPAPFPTPEHPNSIPLSASPHPNSFISSLQMRVWMKNLDSLFDAFSWTPS